MKTFSDYTTTLLALVKAAREIPLGGYPPMVLPPVEQDASKVIIFSPHPDDEVLCGAPLAIRLRREGFPVINVAMTLGRIGTQARRLAELSHACEYLGFDLELLVEDGFDSVKEDLREGPDWNAIVDTIVVFLKEKDPRIIIMHHPNDAHSAHRGTALLVREAINRAKWDGLLFEGEYWRQAREPNLMLEVAKSDLDHMLEALSFHKGELERNPYHIVWPLEMMANVRRSEVVLGWGTEAPSFSFACMYRRNRCVAGTIIPTTEKRAVAAQASIAHLL